VLGAVDSAPLAHRSVTLLLRLLVRLHGEAAPQPFPELVERARAVVAAESLTADDFADDLALVAEMRDRFLDIDADVSAAENRRYDRAFVRTSELFGAVQAYLDQRLPPDKQGLRRHLRPGLAILAALVVGLLVGMRLRPAPPPATLAAASPAPPSAGAPGAVRGFLATFYRDTEHRVVAFTRTDRSIAFDWAGDAPPGMQQSDRFSIRWDGRLHIPEPGEYTFYLTSDDGSRLLIDGRQVIDNWGTHSELTKEAVVNLDKGDHPIRVEYFEELGGASIRLEWSSDRFPRRLVTVDDLK
jgi:hypothetical protein